MEPRCCTHLSRPLTLCEESGPVGERVLLAVSVLESGLLIFFFSTDQTHFTVQEQRKYFNGTKFRGDKLSRTPLAKIKFRGYKLSRSKEI